MQGHTINELDEQETIFIIWLLSTLNLGQEKKLCLSSIEIQKSMRACGNLFSDIPSIFWSLFSSFFFLEKYFFAYILYGQNQGQCFVP